MARPSSGRPVHIATAKQMKVNVPDDLAARFVAIIDDPEAILRKSHVMGDFSGNLEDAAD